MVAEQQKCDYLPAYTVISAFAMPVFVLGRRRAGIESKEALHRGEAALSYASLVPYKTALLNLFQSEGPPATPIRTRLVSAEEGVGTRRKLPVTRGT